MAIILHVFLVFGLAAFDHVKVFASAVFFRAVGSRTGTADAFHDPAG